MRLALVLGKTKRELLTQLDSYELSELMAYYQVEPFGPPAEFLRTGIEASTVANANRDPKKRKKPYQPKDFIPEFGEAREQTWEEQLRIVEMINAAMGGEDKRKR